MRYLIQFSYNGTPFFGFQSQPNEISVQEILEKNGALLLKSPIKIVGAGRTDSGVHAKKMFAHFDYAPPMPFDLKKRLNALLPKSIAIQAVYRVKDHFHARFDATFRSYEYHISTQKNPFAKDLEYQIYKYSLDINAMNLACKYLLPYEDFTSFSKLHTDNKTNNCQLFHAFWKQEPQKIVFCISANRFLRNMVRSIVGTLIEIGSGKYPPEEIHRIIQDKNRQSAGMSVPACGLYLVDVGYDVADLNPNNLLF